ncbi:EI24 domain-containing protein, partial [Leclercia adecarboxylata]|uniref:EI24 domain-containing protein n=1 Tax=Leclercia adecarboxylata TaxID=83655 RepID=UPI00234D55D0|nr:EI24 domain-containing protein [Leclercia adecarboxylata]
PYIDRGVSLLGILAAPYLSWLLFPSVSTAILGLYADRICAAVEQRYFPGLPLPPPTRWGDQFRSMVRLFALSILILPLYLLFLVFPGVNLVLFLFLNGYVLGRGYFDLVALRRLGWDDSRRLWP